MKLNKLSKLTIILISLFFISANAESINITTGKDRNNIYLNQNNCVYFNIKSASRIANFTYRINYDSNKLKYVSGNKLNDVPLVNGNKTHSLKFCFKAKNYGKATVGITITGSGGYDSLAEMDIINNGITNSFNIVKPRPLSDNNNLESLGLEGANISPEFNINTLAYSTELPPFTTKANIIAKAADKNATIKGTGEVDVKDGENHFNINCISESGKVKTYKLNIIVKEAEPIIINKDNKKYLVVQKREDMVAIPDGFIESNTKYKDKVVPSYKNKKTNIEIITVKVDNNKKLVQIKNNDIYPFNYLHSNTNPIIISDDPVDNLDKVKVTIDKNSYTIYKDNNSPYYYFYALDLNTNKKDLYRYDQDTKSYQIERKVEDESNNIYLIITIIALIVIIIVTYVVILIKIISRKDKTNGKTKKKEKKDKE